MYLPAYVHKMRYYLPSPGIWLEPGRAAEAGVVAAITAYFPGSFQAATDEERPFGLLLDVHPLSTIKQGEVSVTLNYRVLDSGGETLLDGKQTAEADTGDPRTSSGTRAAAAKAAQLVAIDLLTKLRPDAAKFPAKMLMDNVSRERLVDHEKPIATGTGFFINAAGQVLTAAHVAHDCALLEAKSDSGTFPSKVVAASQLVDLAVLDTGRAAERFLPLRHDRKIVLGEPVVNVGYPLQSILAASPNLTAH